MEGNALELDEPAQAAGRTHRIVLCCADSVRPMVEEVGRNLEGLGFDSEVVCGAQARAALLGRSDGRSEPTIYVVCVQGTLKEQVLKPLRQALATHGGPNEHLFVAVLDLALPLAMVGQIRRFAEALERMPGKRRKDALGERRQWREHFGRREMEGVRTRAYRPLHVVGRAAAQRKDADRPQPVVGNLTITGPRPIVTKRRPAKIEPTKKYRAVTGALPIIPPEAPKKPKRRRGKGRVRKGKRARQDHAASDAKAAAAHAPADSLRPRPAAFEHAEGRTDRPLGPVPEFGAAIAPERPRTKLLPILGGVAAVAGLVWVTGLGADLWARFGQDPGRGTVAAPQPDDPPAAPDGAPDEAALAAAETPEPSPQAEPDAAPAAATEAADGDDDTPAAGTDGAVEDDGDEPIIVDDDSEAAEAAEPDKAVDDDEPESSMSQDDRDAAAALADAIATHRVRKVRNLYVSGRQGDDTTTWGTALRRCRELEIDGVGRWRLPHRRELKLLHVVRLLDARTFWAYTSVPEDKDFAFVFDTTQGELVEFLKQEPTASVICVRQKRTR